MRIPKDGMEYAGHKYSFNVLHSGQPRPYADHLFVVEIKTDCPYEDVVLEAIQNDVPRKGAQYESACRLFGPSVYFGGYYDIERIPGGFKYTKVEPFTD